ncbi:MAG: PAS domain S-box protein, partial [Candidatus Heimdallarchaeota archaeon]
ISPTTFEFELRTKSGIKKWVSINITPTKIRDEIVYAAMMVDINQRKNTQLALHREREILAIISEATANNVSMSVMCQDILTGMITALGMHAGTFRLLNKVTNSLELQADYGLKENEKYMLYDVSLDDTSHPLIKLNLYKDKIFLTNTELDKEIRKKPIVTDHKYKVYISWPIITANKVYLGTIQFGSRKISNLSEEDKAFFDSICEIIATSIEHIKALEELRESELKFKRTVDNISDGIMIIENQELIYVNNQAETIFGYTFEDLKKMDDFSFINSDDRSRYEMNRDDVRDKQSPTGEEEYWFTRKDGFSRCINNRHSMIIKDDGSYSLYIVTRDITERKLAENALQKLNDELEERVKERTNQLERLNKELEAFSYSVSHDLRTPLRSVDGFSQVLLDDYTDKLDDVGRDYLRRIRAASKRMSDLIDDLLALTQLTRKDFQSQKIDLSKMVTKILADFQENDPKRKAKINIEKNLIVYGDSVLIQTVMENLLGNAWKFSSKKEKTIIKLGSKVINNEKVYYITDNGDGFDMTYANKLFAVFQRLHTEKEFTGTGIGLAIVQRILNRHGGRIWAESQPGKGATFYFTIEQEDESKRSS